MYYFIFPGFCLSVAIARDTPHLGYLTNLGTCLKTQLKHLLLQTIHEHPGKAACPSSGPHGGSAYVCPWVNCVMLKLHVLLCLPH